MLKKTAGITFDHKHKDPPERDRHGRRLSRRPTRPPKPKTELSNQFSMIEGLAGFTFTPFFGPDRDFDPKSEVEFVRDLHLFRAECRFAGIESISVWPDPWRSGTFYVRARMRVDLVPPATGDPHVELVRVFTIADCQVRMNKDGITYKRALAELVRSAVLELIEHELDEWLKVGGVRVRNPHPTDYSYGVALDGKGTTEPPPPRLMRFTLTEQG